MSSFRVPRRGGNHRYDWPRSADRSSPHLIGALVVAPDQDECAALDPRRHRPREVRLPARPQSGAEVLDANRLISHIKQKNKKEEKKKKFSKEEGIAPPVPATIATPKGGMIARPLIPRGGC